MELSEIIPHIEALIFASDKPVTSLEITELINNAFGFMEDKITLDQVESALDGVIEKYNSDFYPFEVRESGGGWQFLTKKEFHKTVAQLNGDKYLRRLSNASLETLSIIAYKQPITKGEIEAIRGVNSDYSVQKLLEKELILITGRNEDLPGKPLVYATSKNFMDYFGLNSPDDLPKIKEVLADQVVIPTAITDDELQPITFPATSGKNEEDLNLAVREDGKLEELDPEEPSGNENMIEIEQEPGIEDTDEISEELPDIEDAGETSEEPGDSENAGETSEELPDSEDTSELSKNLNDEDPNSTKDIDEPANGEIPGNNPGNEPDEISPTNDAGETPEK